MVSILLKGTHDWQDWVRWQIIWMNLTVHAVFLYAIHRLLCYKLAPDLIWPLKESKKSPEIKDDLKHQKTYHQVGSSFTPSQLLMKAQTEENWIISSIWCVREDGNQSTNSK